MQWVLVQRDPDGKTAEVKIDADTPSEAIEILRDRLPEGHQVLSIRRQDYPGLTD